MNKLIAIIILLSFSTPVHARMIMKQDPIESELVTQQPRDDAAEQKKKQLEEDMSREYKKAPDQPAAPVKVQAEKTPGKSGSNWWKWALGVAVVGGIAAAAGGGGGGGDSAGDSGGSSGTGNIGASW